MRKSVCIALIIIICMLTNISYANLIDENTVNTQSNSTNNQSTNNSSNTNESNTNEIKIEGLEELQEQKEKVKLLKEQAESQLEEITEEVSKNLQQISKLDANIESTEKKLEELSTNIVILQKDIEKLKNEYDVAEKSYNEKKEILDKRLVATYKSGETQYLDVLLNSASLTDFISTYFFIQEIIKYDMNLLEKVEIEKNEIEQQNSVISMKQEEMIQNKNTELRTQQVLENTKNLRNYIIKKLSKEEQETQKQIDTYNTQVDEIEKEIVQISKTASFGESYVGGALKWPIANNNKITSYYGMRTHPITGLYKLHSGVDIGASKGTDFLAAAYGVVTKACYNNAYGNMVLLDHGGGVQTLYAHGSSIEVEVGQIVNAGDVVLKVGSTGYSTGPHAHFEIRINGNTVDPLNYIEIPK